MHSLRFWLDHRWAPDRMSDYLDDALPAGQLHRLQRHVGQCVECRRVLAGLTLLLDSLHRLPAPEGGPARVQLAVSVRLRMNEPPTP